MAFKKTFILIVLIISLVVLAINIDYLILQKKPPKPAPNYAEDPFAFFKNPNTWKWILALGLALLVTGLILLYFRINA